MLGRIFFIIIALAVLNSVSALPVKAVTSPSFPACSSPQGNLKVEYSTGTHGVPGQTDTYTGSDAVYALTDSTLTQCLCLDNGQGVQTNWWKVSSLSQEDIDVLRRSGWNFIPNGELWGLDNAPYLAQNSNYSCGGVGGQILGVSTISGSVLGLATTGNALVIAAFLTLGATSLFWGLLFRRNHQ